MDTCTSLQKAILYSLNDSISIKDLKQNKIIQKYQEYQEDTQKQGRYKKIQHRIEKNNIGYLVEHSPGYHFKLHKIPSKPYIIYYQGNIDLLDKEILGIVGPRKMSTYAQQVMQDFFYYLQQRKLATISGGASGIDMLCHTLSIQHKIPTILVLGTGLQYALQGSQKELLNKIVRAGGLIISEFRLNQGPTHYTFPQRNRIIAGLSKVLFVPAAGKKSGSLITIDRAIQIGIPVYSVPASIYEESNLGSNAYIASGNIKALIDFQSFVDKFFPYSRQQNRAHSMANINKDQLNIIEYLRDHGPSSGDHIAQAVGGPISEILADITILEMQGIIYEEQPGIFATK